VNDAVAEGALASNRVRDAVSRLRQLAEDLKVARRAAGDPPRSEPGWPGGEAELIHTLELQPGASDWRVRAAGRYTVVRLEADSNIAVGAVPWAPFLPSEVCVIAPERSTLPAFQPGQPVLVLGRDIHRHRFATEAIERLRSQHADVLVVDMGWPAADRRYADVATFGASRLMGDVLLEWLATETVEAHQ
jgi:beta-N-acetylhexosaminidase